MQSLLETLWTGISGFRCIAARRPGGKLFNYFFSTDAEALAYASALANTGHDVWYSPAIFENEKRDKNQVKAVSALWLDIDCGESKAYPTTNEAIQAVRDFCAKTGLPEPNLVGSGNGLHVYWIVNSSMSPEDFRDLSARLRQACINCDLKADHSVTIDIARILRVPQTFNYKDPTQPKRVELLQTELKTMPLADLRARLAPFDIAPPPRRQRAREVNADLGFAQIYEQREYDAEKIADECAQMAMMRETKGDMPEPTWYKCLQVLALCNLGEDYAHEWSCGYAGYNEAETQAKFERAREYAPATCAAFETAAPELCAGCKHKGKISTPLQLGVIQRELVNIQEVTNEAGETVEVTVPHPKGYEVLETAVYRLPEDEGDDKIFVLGIGLQVTCVMLSSDGSDSEIEIEWRTKLGRKHRRNMRSSVLANARDLDAWLLNQGIFEYTSLKEVMLYLRRSVAHRNALLKPETVYSHFGWVEDGFIVGNDLITETGIRRAYTTQTVTQDRLKKLQEKGDTETWSEATRLLDRPELWAHRFTVLAALGAPLFELLRGEGSILSLAGDSGTGKTTASAFGISAYGDYRALEIQAQSTEVAYLTILAMVRHLPLLVNEAATIDQRLLGQLILNAANGAGRDRGKRTGGVFAKGDWRTLTIFTSNTHLHSLSNKILTDAQRRRVLELTLTTKNMMPLDIGRKLNEVMRENHGGAGRRFIAYVIQHRDAIISRLNEVYHAHKDDVPSTNRFNVWLIAVAKVAGEIGREIGIIRFDVDSAISHTLDSLKSKVERIKPPAERVTDALAEYINRHTGSFVNWNEGEHATYEEVRGEVKGRYSRRAGVRELFLPKTAFIHWCVENADLDRYHIEEWAREQGITTQVKKLTSGGIAMRCLIVPMPEEVEVVEDDDFCF